MNLLSTLLIGISQNFLFIKEILLAVCSDVVSIYVPFIMVALYGSSNISIEKGRIKLGKGALGNINTVIVYSI